MEPIRILHIVTSMEQGGIENFIMNNYRYIDRELVQFDFLKHRDSKDWFDEEILNLGGRIYNVPSINPLKQIKYDHQVEKFFKNNRERYSIVHSHLNALSTFPLRIAKKQGIPVRIAHSHAVPTMVTYKTPIIQLSRSVINRYATDAFACSKEAGDWLFKNRKYSIIPNSIDAEKYVTDEVARKEIREEINVGDGYLIGMVASFRTIKNHSFLINVFSKVLKQIPNAYLVLVGTGKTLEEIKKQATSMNISEHVIFMGVRKDIPRILNALDAFALPSVTEGFSIATLEAETMGLPCIVSTGVPKEVKLFENMKTDFVSVKNEDDWVNKLIAMKNVQKNNFSISVSNTNYDVRKNAKDLMSFYERKFSQIRSDH
ncbi:MAG: glycosyltransferase [Clostridia bacterium]|nr:glycosyltransferase [Clostridia bacterium]